MYTLTLYCRVGISSWSPVFTLTLYYRVGVSTWSPVYTLTLQQAGRPDPPVLDLSEFTVRTPRYTVQWETKTLWYRKTTFRHHINLMLLHMVLPVT